MKSLTPFVLAASAALLLQPVTAQDLLGVAWSGEVVRIDSHNGQATFVATGLYGQNALARSSSGQFWSTYRTSSLQNLLTTVDPATGAVTPVYNGVDIRALAGAQNNLLYGIRTMSSASWLVRIDVTNGVPYLVGNTGFSGIQGLAMHQNVLYAWDVFAGLLMVDTNTGVATDPFPTVAGPAYQQSLCSHPDGRLLLGGGNSNGADQLFVVDTTTGVATLVANIVGVSDLRGIEPLGGITIPAGMGCNGVAGQVTQSLTGVLNAGGFLTTTSGNHEAGTLGALVFGFSTTSYQGHALPYLLDPMYGTSQCWLLTSMDALVYGFTNAANPAVLQFQFGLPSWLAGQQFTLQHVCFEAVPGSMSWSDARTLRL